MKIPSIKDTNDFKKLYKQGKKWHCEGFVIFYEKADESKMAVVASKKVGKAVLRNKAKRVLRELFRSLYQKTLLAQGKYVFVATNEIHNFDFLRLKENMMWGLNKLQCLR